MTQSYYGGNDFDAFSRANHRPSSASHYYDRTAPYGYYELHRELPSEYSNRQLTYTNIQEPEQEGPNAQARRRIAVAVSMKQQQPGPTQLRKASAHDAGDARSSALVTQEMALDAKLVELQVQMSAVAHSYEYANHEPSRLRMRADPHNQVNSTTAIFVGTDTSPAATTNAGPASAGFVPDSAAGLGYMSAPQAPNRSSLPTLQTRTPFAGAYDSQYEGSPTDAYTYTSAGFPRQDSFTGSYSSQDGSRSYNTGGSLSAPVPTSFYEPYTNAYSFGNLQAPTYARTLSGRLPSVTADGLTSLNMGSLHSSLPIQTAQERRLPAPTPPYTISYPQRPYPVPTLPEIRPLDNSGGFRPHINGIYSPDAMPWSAGVESRNNSHANASSAVQSATAAPMTEPVLGYQFPIQQSEATAYSPNVSPTSGPALSESFASTSSSSTSSMPPPGGNRYGSVSGAPLLSFSTEDRPTSSGGTAASLYSFSTEAASRSTSSADGTGAELTPVASVNTYPNLRQPQPQHAASIDSLRRQSSFDQQRAVSQRMSVSSLNGRC